MPSKPFMMQAKHPAEVAANKIDTLKQHLRPDNYMRVCRAVKKIIKTTPSNFPDRSAAIDSAMNGLYSAKVRSAEFEVFFNGGQRLLDASKKNPPIANSPASGGSSNNSEIENLKRVLEQVAIDFRRTASLDNLLGA
ncbi:MAG: hypothetical protein N3G22_02645 [Candidatus Micrarchaeota archaeon]|nr:hypothetical protein [Candidatus Micrarchaeota archaeon]